MNESIIAERILELRTERGMTQLQFGKVLSVSQDTVSLWEKGKSQPSAQYIILLAQTFNVSADYLLGLKDY